MIFPSQFCASLQVSKLNVFVFVRRGLTFFKSTLILSLQRYPQHRPVLFFIMMCHSSLILGRDRLIYWWSYFYHISYWCLRNSAIVVNFLFVFLFAQVLAEFFIQLIPSPVPVSSEATALAIAFATVDLFCMYCFYIFLNLVF